MCGRLPEVRSCFEVDDDGLWAELELAVARGRATVPPSGPKAAGGPSTLNGILFVPHTGIARRDLPAEFG
jgi:hypothetical protein